VQHRLLLQVRLPRPLLRRLESTAVQPLLHRWPLLLHMLLVKARLPLQVRAQQRRLRLRPGRHPLRPQLRVQLLVQL